MKVLIPLLLISASLQAQKSPMYFSLRGGISPKDGQNKGVAHLSMGALKQNTLGVGIGIGYINYSTPYVPITIDFSFWGIPKKISPVIIGQAGYGIYSYRSSLIRMTGGFSGSFNGGISFPVRNRSRVILTGGLLINGFTTETRISSSTKRTTSTVNRFCATAGFKI